MTKNDFMKRALAIAFQRMGFTSPNPPVGAVIVRDGEVLSTGGTRECGSCHAEINAMENAGCDIGGTEMYVTLEPCSHYGKTPPCVDAIIRSCVKKVYIAIEDPNPLVSGRGIAKLIENGVEVEMMHEFEGYARDILRPFNKYILRKKPFVIYKCAETLDGRLATPAGDSKWVSNACSRFIVHKLRSRIDAIIVGMNTLKNDNPSLNVRLGSFDDTVKDYFKLNPVRINGSDNFIIRSLLDSDIDETRDPLRVIIGIPEMIHPGLNVLGDGNHVFFERNDRYQRLVSENPGFKAMKDKLNIEIIDADNYIDEITMIMDSLYARGVMLVMLEGGGTLAGSFLDAGAIDQFMVTIAPRIAGNGIPMLNAAGFPAMMETVDLHDVSFCDINGDLLYNGYCRETY